MAKGARIAVSVAVTATAHSLHAQVFEPVPPADCGVPFTNTRAAADTSGAHNGVVVRLGIGRSDKPADLYLAHAIARGISTQLRTHTARPVHARGDSRRITSAASDLASAIAEGRVLGVDWVVSGTVERRGTTATLFWSVHDTRTGAQRNSGTIESSVTAYDSVAAVVGAQVLRIMNVAVSPAPHGPGVLSRSPAAIEHLAEALYYYDRYTPQSLEHAEQSISKALAADSTLFGAWLALADLRIAQSRFGATQSAASATSMTTSAIAAAHRALALAPNDVQALERVARAHLLRGEVVPARQAIEGMRANNALAEYVLSLDVDASIAAGHQAQTDSLLRTIDYRALAGHDALFALATWHRHNNRGRDACRVLNRAVLISPSFSPAIALRSLVRTSLGDLRGAWIDAELVARNGRTQWSAAAAAIADVASGDTANARMRLATTRAPGSGQVVSPFDALLTAGALLAIRDASRAVAYFDRLPCSHPGRAALLRDPLITPIARSTRCNDGASVGRAHPASDLAQRGTLAVHEQRGSVHTPRYQ